MATIKMVRKSVLGLIGLTGIFLLFFLASCGDAASPPMNTGGVGDKLTTPDSVEVTFLGREQIGVKMFFHFHVHNGSSNDMHLFGKSDIYQFRVPLKGADTLATIPTTGSDTAQYPPLPSQIKAGASVDGWVTLDITSIDTPKQIMYAFGQIDTKACTNPQDQSTCQPSKLFTSLLWNF